jgi:glycosyltransferase involved in cell wall biosynthesis
MTPPQVRSTTTFVILSWEGPDPYSNAGGLGVRVSSLAQALVARGFETHLFFVGDPDRPGHEAPGPEPLHLHRWCQWISDHHRAGVYDGEEGKLTDWTRSLPLWLETEFLEPRVTAGQSIVVLAEEWQTVGSVIALRDILIRRNWQDQVHLFWNANNTYSFDRVDWGGLSRAAHVTTVSRYMKHAMWPLGVDARVIPNGIPQSWLAPVDRRACRKLERLFRDRLVLLKVARWHPDKRWIMAVDAVAALKDLGERPLFVARGGMEDHVHEVVRRARDRSLTVGFARFEGDGVASLIDGVKAVDGCDMVVLESYLSEAQRRALFRKCNAVLANSGVEPFGLVGLEVMAVGGMAFVGSTGEDYVTPGYDAVSLQTNEPREIVYHVLRLRSEKKQVTQMRQAARRKAMRYTWAAVVERALLPCLRELGVPVAEDTGQASSDGLADGPGPERTHPGPKPRRRKTNGHEKGRARQATGVMQPRMTRGHRAAQR